MIRGSQSRSSSLTTVNPARCRAHIRPPDHPAVSFLHRSARSVWTAKTAERHAETLVIVAEQPRADLESVLGASPRGFESPILRGVGRVYRRLWTSSAIAGPCVGERELHG